MLPRLWWVVLGLGLLLAPRQWAVVAVSRGQQLEHLAATEEVLALAMAAAAAALTTKPARGVLAALPS